MSIKVTIRRLAQWRNDLADQIKVEKLNEVAEDFADEIRRELGNLQCKKHPDETSQVTIIQDENIIELHGGEINRAKNIGIGADAGDTGGGDIKFIAVDRIAYTASPW